MTIGQQKTYGISKENLLQKQLCKRRQISSGEKIMQQTTTTSYKDISETISKSSTLRR
jgi:hypothetical protein